MEPQHASTEFASKRHLEKLNQSTSYDDSGSNNLSMQGAPLTAGLPPLRQDSFILPLREARSLTATHDDPYAKHVDGKRHDKSKFFKKILSHSKQSPVTPSHWPEALGRSSQSLESKREILLDQRLTLLPTELQVHILSSLALSDILHLRCASRFMHYLVTRNEASIVKMHLQKHIPAYAQRLYPPPEGHPLTFHYLCGIWHRLHVAAKLAHLMCEWIMKEVFLKTTDAERAEFAPRRERMRRRLIPILFTIFHFFEKYREHYNYLLVHDDPILTRGPEALKLIEARIMRLYDDQTLLRVHEAFPLVISSFCRRLRPPSYAGRFERSIRGYIRDKPADDVYPAVLCLGGLRQVLRFWEIKSYNDRVATVDAWYAALSSTKDHGENDSKRRRFGFGRKHSSLHVRDAARSAGASGENRSSSSSISHRHHNHRHSSSRPHNTHDASTTSPYVTRCDSLSRNGDYDGHGSLSYIFNTSLAAGEPMQPPTKDLSRSFLAHLPTLTDVWLPTGQATILERRIVERAADIRRNGQVLIDLIQDHGVAEEDEWLYGTSAPESVQADLGALDDTLP